MMNCSGGKMPWGTWVTCEETVNGPDVGPDFTGAPNHDLEQPHGYIFEVPSEGVSANKPVRSAGRFAHEAAVYENSTKVIYLTEDNGCAPDQGRFRLEFDHVVLLTAPVDVTRAARDTDDEPRSARTRTNDRDPGGRG